MREICLTFSACDDAMICIGKQGENMACCVRIDCRSQLESVQVADGVVKVKNGNGDTYIAPCTMNDGFLEWPITGSDTAVCGMGQAQIELLGYGGEVLKTAILQVGVLASLAASDDPPQPVRDWLDNANDLLLEVGRSAETANSASQCVTQALEDVSAAKNAANSAAEKIDRLTASATVLTTGSQPTVIISEVDGHKHISFGVPTGPKGDTGSQGPQGVPGDGNVNAVDGVISDSGGNVVLSAVRYGAVQVLTEQQKTLARSNIGACALLDMYPVGSTYMSTVSTSPAELFGGTWSRIQDRFLLAAGLHAAGSVGGEASHVLTIEEMPSHSHNIAYSPNGQPLLDMSGNDAFGLYAPVITTLTVTSDYGAYYHTGTNGTGGWQAHNNMPPYLAVYMWYRVS